MNTLKVGSLNVRGFRDLHKRQQVFNMFSLEGWDVLFIQETHCTNIKEAKSWGQNFHGKLFWSFGSKHSRGGGIILSPHLNFELGNFDFDFEGRFLILDLTINDVDFRFITIYAPNNGVERKTFINNLAKYLVTKRNLVLGGDFNFVDSISLDKKGGDTKAGDIGHAEMKALCTDFSLIDSFRVLYENKREFTWEGLSERGKVLCRLDSNIKTCLTSVKHGFVSSGISDHCCVNINLDLSKLSSKLGRGFWECNTSVLYDLNLQEDIKNLWARDLEGLGEISGEVWDQFKVNSKEIIKFHSKRLYIIKRQKYKSLQYEYRKYKMLNQNSGLHDDKLQELDSQIKECIDNFIEGSKIRSKVNILNFDEKPSRYFLNREKRKANKKTIKNLEVSSGERVSDIKSILKHVKDFYAQLFQKEEVDQSLIDYFFKDLKSLTEDQSKLCEGILSKTECQKALFDMKNGKSPGIDGLPKEFYCIFWNFLGDSFVNMANTCFNNNSLSASQKLGVISLICKNQEKAHLLNYWRPVTL